MLFKKIFIPFNNSCNWYMILKSYEDVYKYMEIDTELHAHALFSLADSINKSHMDGSRQKVINQMIQTKQFSIGVDEKCSPVDLLDNLLCNKTKAMLKIIDSGRSVLVQKTGSYCDLEGYISIWNAVEKDSIEKDSLYIPNEKEIIESDCVILENSERLAPDFQNEISKILNDHFYKLKRVYLKELKLQDPKYVFEMISKTKCILFESQLTDNFQIDQMFNLFLKLKNKRIVIKTPYKEKLINHSLFNECNLLHTIEFI